MRNVRPSDERRPTRRNPGGGSILAAGTALALLLPLVPLLPLEPAPVQAQLDDAEGQAPTAVWRVHARSWLESWGEDGEERQKFEDVQFVDPHHGFARLGLLGGDASLLATETNKDGELVWSVAHELGLREVEFFDQSTAVSYGSDVDGNSRLAVSDNGGRTWGLDTEPKQSPEDFAFATTDFDRGEEGAVFAVGDSGWVAGSFDGGATWRQEDFDDRRDDPESPGIFHRLHAVSFAPALSPADAPGVAVGQGGTILVTRNDGRILAAENGSTGNGWEPVTDVALPDGTAVPGVVRDELVLSDVDVVRDEGDPDGRTVAVAIGESRSISGAPSPVVLWSEWGNDEAAAAEWTLQPLGEPLHLRSVTLADTSDEPGGLTGYAVGGELTTSADQGVPLVLEMGEPRGGMPTWVKAPVDPRAAAFVDAFSGYALESVTTVPGQDGAAFAVGGRLMLERTPVDSDDPTTFGEAFADPEDENAWWRCAPTGGLWTGTNVDDQTQPDADEALREAVEENASEEQVCEDRGESLEAATIESFAGDPRLRADPCRLEQNPESASAMLAPCQATWQPFAGADSEGEPRPTNPINAVFLDDDMAGEGRRLVAVGTNQVFLVDPDASTGEVDAHGRPIRGVQRGVEGFGEGWSGRSAFGADTGMVDLREAPGFPSVRMQTQARALVYDDEHHRLYKPSFTTRKLADPVIATVGLTGDVDTSVTSIPIVETEGATSRVNSEVMSMAFDSTHEMLYVLTETRPRREFTVLDAADTVQVTLHAYYAGDLPETEDRDERSDGVLTRAWSQSLEDHSCRSLNNLPFFGVGPDGAVLSFACMGHASVHFGSPNFEPNRIVTVRLRLRGEDAHPRMLSTEAGAGDVVVHTEPIAGKVLQEDNVTLGDETRNVLLWNQTREGASVWDFHLGGWIGLIPRPNINGVAGMSMDAKRSKLGRLYVSCGGSGCARFDDDEDASLEPALMMVDTLNVPAQVPAGVTEEVHLPDGAGRVMAVVPPRRGEEPRVVLASNDALHFFEDRVRPVGRQVREDPDDFTFPDVPESEASEVKRISHANAYGAHFWWTGLGTATTPACDVGIEDDPSRFVLGNDTCEKTTLSYNWMTDRDATVLGTADTGRFGRHTTVVPGLPGGGRRELRLGEVQNAELENNKLGRRSSAKATALFYDGGPADDSRGTTGDDVHRRRGRDPHRHLDAELAQLCGTFGAMLPFQAGSETEQGCRGTDDSGDSDDSGDDSEPDGSDDESEEPGPHEQFEEEAHGPFDTFFEEFEQRFDELVDRFMREFDGQRKIRGSCDGEDCFDEFDHNDPRCDRDDDGNVDCSERGSIQEHVGVFHASSCLGDEEEQFRGSRAECADWDEAGDFGRTAARAELNGLAFVPGHPAVPEGVMDLSIGSSGSETDLVRDPDDGIVAVSTAWASDVTLEVADRGSLQIGEVRSTGRVQAHGRPDTAHSSLDVTFQDVVIRGSDEGEDVRFACGASDEGDLTLDPTSPPSHEELRDEFDGDGDGTPDECDPHRVAAVISMVFAGKVQATTSARDTDPRTAGSLGGALAMLRRDPVEVLSDEVINRFTSWEVPALQLTIFNDGLRANRMKIDLAGVYGDANYEIGPRAVEAVEPPPEPGTVEVALSDPAGEPLEGGGFAVHEDTDGDGVLGSNDPMVGGCTTTGSGSCSVAALKPGSYLVAQRVAPSGFRPTDQSVGVFVREGARETVTFVNAADTAAVEVLLVDPSGEPLGGGEFALAADDGDGAIDPTDSMLSSCVTGDDGGCRFSGVPLGDYVLHQAAAPRGFEGAEDIPFALHRPGQVARINIVNGVAVAGSQVEIIEIIEIIENSSVSTGPGGGQDTVWGQIVGAPQVFADILLRDPIQALLFGLTAGLFGAPLYLAVRRRDLSHVRRGR